MKFFDTHCHLNHSSFQPDMDAVLQRAIDSGVSRILIPGWDLESSQAAVELARKHPQIDAAVGLHPTEIVHGHPLPIDEIRKMAELPEVVAIGEIGLDYHHDPDHIQEQRSLLAEMLSIACDVNKKVILHSRESMNDIKQIVIDWVGTNQPSDNHPAKFNGIFHAFEGNLQDALELMQFGFMFGVGGPLTYKNAHVKQKVFAALPDDAICLETDAPYLAPAKHRGQRNEPSYLPLVGASLAELRNAKEDALLDQVFQNGYKMFTKDEAS